MFTKILTSSLLFLIAIGGFFVSVEDGGYISIKNNLYAACSSDPSSIDYCNESDKASDLKASTQTESQSKWLNDIVQAVNIALGILTVIVSPAIIFAGWLLSPDWTSGDLFGLREPMHKMWVIVSNIVYFIYAILLIIIALATIFGKENFSYKTMIPKLALGILMVPFTWWFVQWTISLATVVTASVINIPMDMVSDKNELINAPIIPKNYYVTTTTNSKGGTSTTNTSSTGGGKEDCTKELCISAKDMLEKGGGTYSTLLIYAYQVFRVQDYKDINQESNPMGTIGQLVNGLLIGGIMFLVFGLLVMALIAMLLIRAIKLWMYAIFSPIFTLHFVAGKELFGKGTDGFDIKEFIGLCFIPAVVGLCLSFGLMIISVIQSPNIEKTGSKCTTIDMTITGDKVSGGCTLINMFGNPENKITRGIVNDGDEKWIYNIVSIAGVQIFFKGQATLGDIDKIKKETDSIIGGLSAVGGIFGTIIVDIIALVFIWMAFMAAKGITKAVDAAVEPFEAMGKKIGGMAMSAPKYIPIPGTGGQSAASLQRSVELGASKIQEEKMKNSTEKAGKLVPWAVKGIIQPEDRTAITDAIKTGMKQATVDDRVNTIGSATGKAISKGAEFRGDNFEVISKSWQEVLKGQDEGRIGVQLRQRGFDENDIKATIKMVKGDKLERVEEERIWKAIQTKFGTAGGTNGSTAASGTSLLEKAGDKNINININGKTESTINIDSPKTSALNETTKRFITENITEDDLRAGLNGKGLTKEQQDNIITEFKPILKPKT